MKITTIHDYIDKISEKFPGIPKEEINKIIAHGFEKLCGHVRYGREVYLQKNDFTAFFGTIKRNKLDNFIWYRRKLRRKLKWLRVVKGCTWDKKYAYFGVTATKHFEYCSFMFDNDFKDIKFNWGLQTVCKYIEDVPLVNAKAKYIYRVPKEDVPEIEHRSVPKLHVITSNAELIRACPHVSYKDINPAIKGNYEYV